MDDDFLNKNPVDGVYTSIKRENHFERPKRQSLTMAQQTAFVNWLSQNPRYRCWAPLFAFFLGTGCRVGEVTGLRWCDVDFEKKEISINHTLQYRPSRDGTCGFSVTSPKTKSGNRTIPLLPEVEYALLAEKSFQKQCSKKCEMEIGEYKDFVFLNRYDTPYTEASINRALRRIIKQYNEDEKNVAQEESREPQYLPSFTCHHLRHTFCTRLCEAEINVKVIQDIMGHADAQTTLDIYSDVQKELRDRSVSNIINKFPIFNVDDTMTPMLTPKCG